MLNQHILNADKIAEFREQLNVTRADIGTVEKWRLEHSRRGLPSPVAELTESEVVARIEPKKVRWHRDLVPEMRQTGTPETFPYFRWSTDKQEYSIDSQRAIVDDYYGTYAKRLKLPSRGEHEFADPETSGATLFFERLGGGQLGRYMRPGDHVIVAYFDRFGRDMLDLLRTLKVMLKMSVYVHLIDHPSYAFCDPTKPGAVAEIQRRAIDAENERRMTSVRTRNSYRTHLNNGRALGAVGDYCFKKVPNPNYVPGLKDNDNTTNPPYLAVFEPYDAAACEIIYQKWLEGWTAYEIAKAFRNRGIVRRAIKGRRWTSHDIRRIILKLHTQRSTGGAFALAGAGA